MSTLWYFAHDEKKLGPFTQSRLKEMAAAGTILPMDTVWLDGVEQGVLASRVKNLFPRVSPNTPSSIDELLAGSATSRVEPVTLAANSSEESLVVNCSLVPLESYKSPKEQPKAAENTPKRGRVVALKGADIVSQDGTHARYRKKCIECGHKDSACHTIPILNKLIKQNFFCPKCRKRRDVAIQCHS